MARPQLLSLHVNSPVVAAVWSVFWMNHFWQYSVKYQKISWGCYVEGYITKIAGYSKAKSNTMYRLSINNKKFLAQAVMIRECLIKTVTFLDLLPNYNGYNFQPKCCIVYPLLAWLYLQSVSSIQKKV